MVSCRKLSPACPPKPIPAEAKLKKSVKKASDNITHSGNIAIKAIIKRLTVFNRDILELFVETIKLKPPAIVRQINNRSCSQMLLKKTMK